MTERLTFKDVFWLLILGFGLVFLLIGLATSFLSNQPAEVKLPVLAIIGVISLLASLTLVSVAFSVLNLSDTTQALALPEGSIRAVIALSLIVIFSITSIFLYGSLSDRGLKKLELLTPTQKEAVEKSSLKSDIVLTTSTDTDKGPRYTIYYNAPGSQASAEFAKEVFVMLGTLVTAVASFYFGSRAATDRNPTSTPTPLPTITSINPISGTRGSTVTLNIIGSNLQQTQAVRIVRGSVEVPASDITSTETLISCSVSLVDANLEVGDWDVVVISDGGTIKRDGAFRITQANP